MSSRPKTATAASPIGATPIAPIDRAFQFKDATSLHHPQIPIGTAVRVKANNLPGTVRGVWDHQGSVTRYSVEYVANGGVIHEAWFRPDEFTITPPPKPARKR